jgi:hypothetical protein
MSFGFLMIQCCFLKQYFKLPFISVSKNNSIPILKKSNSSMEYPKSLSSEIIHRIKLRLSRPSETPSEGEGRGEGGEEEEEERDDDDDFDTSHCHRYVFRCQRKKGGSKLFQNEGHNGELLSLWACDNIKASLWGRANPLQR